MATPKAIDLLYTLRNVDKLIEMGLSPYQAMSATLSVEDWLMAYVAFKTLVMEANEKEDKTNG